MKTELNETNIRLVPENYSDKMYIARFIKELDAKGLLDQAEEGKATVFVEAEFSYSKDRCPIMRGGGWLDPKQLADSLYDVEDNEDEKGTIAIEEITSLTIQNYPL